MKNGTPSFLKNKRDYYTEVINGMSTKELEEIYIALSQIDDYLNSSLVNPIVPLRLEDLIKDKRVVNFLRYDVAFLRDPKSDFILENGAESAEYLYKFKNKVEKIRSELVNKISPNISLTMWKDGKVEYKLLSKKIKSFRFRPEDNPYKLLRYLITNDKTFEILPYKLIGEAIDTGKSTRIEMRTITDTVTYIRKRLRIKANSDDDIFMSGNGFGLKVNSVFI